MLYVRCIRFSNRIFFSVKGLSMSFWGKIKKAAVSAKCMAGLHSGDYSPIIGMPECQLEKTCPDCGKYITKTEHKFKSWEYLNNQNCNSKRECFHCGTSEEAVRHQWKKVKNDECHVLKECSRCNDSEFVRIEHTWYAGVAHADGMQTYHCSGCGKLEERQFDPNAR